MKEKPIPYGERRKQEISQIMREENLDHRAATAKWERNRKELHKQNKKEMAEVLDVLFELLDQGKVSMKELAARYDVSLKTVYRWKSGESCPSKRALISLRDVLRMLDLERRVTALEKKLQM